MMKKILTFLFICFCGYGAMAQLPVNIGIHGGVSSTKIKVRDIPAIKNNDARTGYMFGAFVRLNLSSIYIEPSLNYSHKESEYDINNANETSKAKINSFDIPIVLGYNIIDVSLLTLRAYVGPVVSFPGKVKLTGYDIDSKDAVWNGKIGVGVDVWKLTFDIDYEKSFQKLGHELKAPRSFNFTLGLKII